MYVGNQTKHRNQGPCGVHGYGVPDLRETGMSDPTIRNPFIRTINAAALEPIDRNGISKSSKVF